MHRLRILSLVLFLFALLPVTIRAQEAACPETRLTAGGHGIVTPGDPNRLRDAASTTGAQIGQIPGGATFEVLEGPQCVDGFLWWRVEYQGIEGWTVEGNADSYFVDPHVIVPTATPVPEYIGLTGADELSWSADGKKLAVATADGLYIFDAEAWGEAPTIVLDDYAIRDIAFNPADSNTIAVVVYREENYSASIFSLETGDAVALIGERPIMPPDNLVFSADGSILAYNNGGTLVAVDTETFESVHGLMLKDYTNGAVAYMGANHVTISPDGATMGAFDGRPLIVPTGGDNDSVVIFDRETIDTSVNDIAFSPDSTQFIIGDVEGNLQMWDIETGERTSFIRGTGVSISNRINALAFSPDGETVATAESEPQAVVRIYHAVNLRQKAAFSGGRLAEAAHDVAFNPDGTLLAAIFDDTVRIIDTTDYTQVTELVAGRD